MIFSNKTANCQQTHDLWSRTRTKTLSDGIKAPKCAVTVFERTNEDDNCSSDSAFDFRDSTLPLTNDRGLRDRRQQRHEDFFLSKTVRYETTDNRLKVERRVFRQANKHQDTAFRSFLSELYSRFKDRSLMQATTRDSVIENQECNMEDTTENCTKNTMTSSLRDCHSYMKQLHQWDACVSKRDAKQSCNNTEMTSLHSTEKRTNASTNGTSEKSVWLSRQPSRKCLEISTITYRYDTTRFLYFANNLFELCKLFIGRTQFCARSTKMSPIAFVALFLLLLLTRPAPSSARYESYAGRGNLRGLPRAGLYRHTSLKARSQRCENITVPMCKDIGYNTTDMSLAHITNKYNQNEALEDLKLFNPLLIINCSAELKLFLCSLYTPICMKDYPTFLPPCRFVCERARAGCYPLMKKYGYEWPTNLRCEQFPRYTGKNQMCMHFNLTKLVRTNKERDPGRKNHNPSRSRTSHEAVTTLPTSTTAFTTVTQSHVTKTSTAKSAETTRSSTTAKAQIKPINQQLTDPTEERIENASLCICREPLVLLKSQDPMYDQVSTGSVPNCAVSCFSPYFTDDQRMAAETWIKSWSIFCFVVTMLTVSTFLIDMERFKYPERPIIFLSTCYMFVSIGFLIRIIAGHEAVACSSRSDHVLYHTTGPVLCTTVFLLVYFFSMASALWWVILSLTWFLAAGLKWGSEAIASYSQYYHAAAWLIPSLKSIMVLAMSSVDGDSLSGICLVGNQDVRALRGFVLAPLVVYLALGGMFLLAGFISLFRIRSKIRKDGSKTDKLETLMGRIGIFSVLYMVPAAALVSCYFYEQQYRPLWEESHNCRRNIVVPDKQQETIADQSRNHQEQSNSSNLLLLLNRAPVISQLHNPQEGPARPEFSVFMVRYLMTLLIGITNGVWICSSKTVVSWKGFYRRCVCCLCGPRCPTKSEQKKQITSPCQECVNGDNKISKCEDGGDSQKSEGHSVKQSDNRCDSSYSRQHRPGSRGLSKNSRASSRCTEKHAGEPSEISHCGKCHSSELGNDSYTSHCERSRRKKRICCTQKCLYLDTEPRTAENEEVFCNGGCCSNTTTTDGSEKPSITKSADVCPEMNRFQREDCEIGGSCIAISRDHKSLPTYVLPRSASSSHPSNGSSTKNYVRDPESICKQKTSSASLRDCVFQICEDTCVRCAGSTIIPGRDIQNRYGASNSELLPCLSRRCSSRFFSHNSKLNSQSAVTDITSSTISTASPEEEQFMSLLPKESIYEIRNKKMSVTQSPFHRHNHFHHHHYHDVGKA